MKRSRAHDSTPFGHGQLGRAAANVHVKNSAFALGGKGDCAGAVSGEQRFKIMAGAGANEIPPLGGEEVRDGPSVVSPNRLAREDDGSRVHMLRTEPRFLVRIVDEARKRLVVDPLSAGRVGCKMDGREVERLALRDDEAAGQFPP